MIKKIRYKNFKALRNATLPLGRFTLLVGANGTGKSTALKALEIAKNPKRHNWKNVVSIDEQKPVSLYFYEDEVRDFGTVELIWRTGENDGEFVKNNVDPRQYFESMTEVFKDFKIYSFDSDKIAEPVSVKPNIKLEESGRGLAGVLDQLRDSDPERFEELNREMNKWFYEFDRILFETPKEGVKSFLLRTTFGKHKIKAEDISDGTRLALAYLTLAYLPNPPKIVAFEEPEKGIHPRLLRNIQEAMDRLAYPENFGEKREPIQVIATTHSPYLLDLYKDRREEIVISDKDEEGVHFQRLSELPHIEKILREQDVPLGDIWYSGVLGGVPVQP